MLTGLDHAILGLRDLAAADACGRALGLVVAPGGEHPGRGTRNAIVRFGLDYLELIAVADPAVAASDDQGQALLAALNAGEGWLGFALASDDLEADVAAARARGLAIGAPAPGARRRPDGSLLRWRTARVAGSPWGARLPFLIQHETPAAERLARAPRGGHPLGATRLAGLSLAVSDLAGVTADYERLLGVPAVVEEVPALPARRSVFTLGSFRLELLQPAAADGGLADFARQRGAGLFMASLAVANVDAAVAELRRRGTAVGNPTWRRRAPLLDPAQTAGARFQVVEGA